MKNIAEIIEDLQSRKRAVSCNGKKGLLAILKELGFQATQGQANHFIFTHIQLSTISEFTTFSIDCGHYPKKPMKFPLCGTNN
ncbi:hypothetical protein A1D22_10535 [Pasteurellaceae bacterium LFhippo2]|nr:hypothetical protein [Pasteurellaceae bacterium LFhippo2]